jgi:hypothetical protein
MDKLDRLVFECGKLILLGAITLMMLYGCVQLRIIVYQLGG